MKITYTSYDSTTIIEQESDGIDINELGMILYNICLSKGWNKKLLKTIFKENVTNG